MGQTGIPSFPPCKQASSMKTFLFLVALLMLFSCNNKEKTEEKNPTRAECESIQDENECKKAGCLYSCGISLWAHTDGCLGRRAAAICSAPVRFEGGNNQDYWLTLEGHFKLHQSVHPEKSHSHLWSQVTTPPFTLPQS